MGSSPSKNKKTKHVSNVVNATFAFDDAANRAAEKRRKEDGGGVAKEAGGDVGGRIGVSEKETAIQANGEVKNTTQTGTTADASDDEEVDEFKLSNATTKIQSLFRGYKERQLRKKETEMAIRIQRTYRRHSAVKKALSDGQLDATSPPPEASPTPQPLAPCTEDQSQEPEQTPPDPKLNETKARLENLNASASDGTKKYVVRVGQETKENFIAFQDEITELKWYAEQQLERALCGIEFVGPRIVLVSSKIPKGDLLAKIVRKNVLIFNYDFDKDTFDALLENIRVNLQAFKEGCKARSICLYCQGGPGFLYIRRSKVVTVAKLKKECEQDQVRFFKELGKFITKIEPEKSVIHVMGCNVLGNNKGQELFDYLQDLMRPNMARFEAPLELAPAGVDMIDTYFDFEKYKIWRSHKHSKVALEL